MKADISVSVYDDDMDGSDPLPQYLANATLTLPDGPIRRTARTHEKPERKGGVSLNCRLIDPRD